MFDCHYGAFWPDRDEEFLARTLAALNSDSGTGGPPQTTPRKMVRSVERQIVYTMTRTASGKGIALHQG